jgi:hypothetical protein
MTGGRVGEQRPTNAPPIAYLTLSTFAHRCPVSDTPDRYASTAANRSAARHLSPGSAPPPHPGSPAGQRSGGRRAERWRCAEARTQRPDEHYRRALPTPAMTMHQRWLLIDRTGGSCRLPSTIVGRQSGPCAVIIRSKVSAQCGPRAARKYYGEHPGIRREGSLDNPSCAIRRRVRSPSGEKRRRVVPSRFAASRRKPTDTRPPMAPRPVCQLLGYSFHSTPEVGMCPLTAIGLRGAKGNILHL